MRDISFRGQILQDGESALRILFRQTGEDHLNRLVANLAERELLSPGGCGGTITLRPTMQCASSGPISYRCWCIVLRIDNCALRIEFGPATDHEQSERVTLSFPLNPLSIGQNIAHILFVDQLCDFIESFATLPIARSSEQLFNASENIRLLRSGRVGVNLS